MDLEDIPDIIDDELNEDEKADEDEDVNIEIIIEDDGDWDEEEIKELEVHLNKLQKFAEKHLGKGKTTYTKQKNKILRNIKKSVEHMDILLLSHAFANEDTYAGYLRKREELSKGLVKSLLSDLDADGKIILLRDILWEISGDEEPIDFYIS